MKKIIIFNWKMNPSSLKEAKRLFYQMRIYTDKTRINADIVIAPPFVYLSNLAASAFAKGYGGLRFASQNVFWENSGTYTGEISPKMLKNLGVEYVLIGHSERRKYLNETDEMINKKILASLRLGLKVVLCVGEDLVIRKRGLKALKNYVKKQLEKDLKNIKSLVISYKSLVRNLVIAYEPIWAIGTGKPCRPEDAIEMIKFIKSLVVSRWSLVVSVLYGGSVDSRNIGDFLKHKEIDGALVGGASIKPKKVKKIIEIAAKIV